ncbi:metallophosphoesterase family protein [Ferruginibacter lapsinanis]|uniref:purple acid phosphatase family protein n=1 Tax=Ferruginibacter lapsinanis TaxID=563172 RepID=UPI001E584426|nr:metallophosphoesterase family protein [Ferruginibacter lapsinanis]UEG51084.1 metallophosphoesterase family protein [Ferruginibacter lapsinanis]
MMKKFIVVVVSLLFTHFLFANDILISFGETSANAPEWKYKGGGSNYDAVGWKDLSYPASDWLTGKSALGFGTNPPVRNTNILEDASAGGGGISGARYPTLYFRKIINIATPSAYANFQIRTKFDDGIVIWINGVEAFRNNISANPGYATFATAAIANNGADIYTATISSSLFLSGNNIIAVEVHQNSVTSSDLFFDMELTGITSQTFLSFGTNSATAPDWKYKGGGSNYDGVNWKDLSYPASDWLTGKSALGFGTNPPARNTNIPEDATAGGGGVSGTRYPTMYFRKIINIAEPDKFLTYQLQTKFDDGIVVWVNGAEAFRNNIAANPGYATLATVAIANNGADIYTATISPSMFVAGNNIVAVEVHQNLLTSSDLYFDMELTGLSDVSLTRGPYLQNGTTDSLTLRWRTDVASNSKVKWGVAYGNYTDSVVDLAVVTEHIIRIGKLQPDTKYYYTIGGTNYVLQSATDNTFTTLPPGDTKRKLRFLALGDCGTNSANQINVKNSFINYIGNNTVDAMLLLGDNAYSSGTDAEFQTGFFDVYKDDLLKYYKLYPTPGNHDYGNTTANTGRRDMPYHTIFTVPKNGEAGGVPSGVTNYYSYNIGDVHFVSLDSYGKDDINTTNMYDTSGAQATWLKKDLAANTKRWTVVYFHHPPYTKTSHNSDDEQDLAAIREKFIQILERYGVDLVLCGHAHAYERSYLLKGFYRNFANQLKDADFNAALHTATGNTQNGNYNGTLDSCAYAYNSGKYAHGSIYVVSGSAGKLDGVKAAGYPQDCMAYSNVDNGGCFYFEVDSNRLDAKFVSYSTGPLTPVVRDSFTIFKDVNKVKEIVVLKDSPLVLSASWRGAYVWPGNGNVVTQSVSPSTAVAGNFNYSVRDKYNCIKDSFYVTVVSPDVKFCLPSSNGILLSNLSGSTYQWQVNNGSGYVNISDNANYTGAGTNLLRLTNVPSAYTGNLYRCVVDGQNGLVFELRFVNIWLGTVSSAWETPPNWSCGVLPDENTDVIINSGTPVLSSNTAIRSIHVNSGATFTVAENFQLITK